MQPTARDTAPPASRLALIGAGFAALLGCLLVFGAIAEDVHEQEANALDALATPLLHGLSSPTLDALMRTATDLGSTLVVAPSWSSRSPCSCGGVTGARRSSWLS